MGGIKSDMRLAQV